MAVCIPACDYCKKRYCVSHQVPEGHGCRDAVKNAGRMQASKEANSTRQATKSSNENRAKIVAKIKALEEARKKK
jgi:hypothetical protein